MHHNVIRYASQGQCVTTCTSSMTIGSSISASLPTVRRTAMALNHAEWAGTNTSRKEIEEVLIVEPCAQCRTRVRDIYNFLCLSILAA
jgi:hypothetical protein